MRRKTFAILTALVLIAAIYAFFPLIGNNDMQVADNTQSVPETQTQALTQPQTQIQTEANKEEQNTQASEEEIARKIAEKYTVEYTDEEYETYSANAFVMLIMPHWEPGYLLKDWEEMFGIEEITLEVTDEEYGTADVTFKGVSMHEILCYEDQSAVYTSCTIYNRPGEHFDFTREELAEEGIYLMAYCEDKVFGFPQDGGTGPFLLVSTAGGKGKIISEQVVSVYVIDRPYDNPVASDARQKLGI